MEVKESKENGIRKLNERYQMKKKCNRKKMKRERATYENERIERNEREKGKSGGKRAEIRLKVWREINGWRYKNMRERKERKQQNEKKKKNEIRWEKKK